MTSDGSPHSKAKDAPLVENYTLSNPRDLIQLSQVFVKLILEDLQCQWEPAIAHGDSEEWG